jgi:SPP1 gp7 family putative phage head morphogenesis protein
MPTTSVAANAQLQALGVDHLVGLRRLEDHIVRDISKLLTEAQKDIAATLEARLSRAMAKGVDPGPWSTGRIEALLTEVKKINREAYKAMGKQLSTDLKAAAEYEMAWQAQSLENVLPVSWSAARPSKELLQAIVRDLPMAGSTMQAQVSKQAANQLAAIRGQLALGLTQGETVPQLMQRVVGSKRSIPPRPGVLQIPKHQAEALVRTATNHTTTSARQALYAANTDVLKGYQYIATLDGNTTLVCASLDGQVFTFGKGPLPPQHWNCRSSTTPVVKSWKEMGLDGGEFPDMMRESLDGKVPEKLSFSNWINGKRSSDPKFFDNYFGKYASTMRANPDLRVGDLLNKFNQPLTLGQLATIEGVQIPAGVVGIGQTAAADAQAVQQALDDAAKAAKKAKAAADKATKAAAKKAKAAAKKAEALEAAKIEKILAAEEAAAEKAAEQAMKEAIAKAAKEDAKAKAAAAAEKKAKAKLAKEIQKQPAKVASKKPKVNYKKYKEPKDYQEAIKLYKQLDQKYGHNLANATPEEYAALSSYADSSGALNTALRGKPGSGLSPDPTEALINIKNYLKKNLKESQIYKNLPKSTVDQIAKDVRALDRLLARSFAEENMTVYRGAYVADYDGTGIVARIKSGELGVGSTFSDSGFASTSVSRDVAWGFAGDEAGTMRMAIRVPKGQQGVQFVGKATMEQQELEFLLARNSHYRIVQAKVNENGSVDLLVDYIGSVPDELAATTKAAEVATAADLEAGSARFLAYDELDDVLRIKTANKFDTKQARLVQIGETLDAEYAAQFAELSSDDVAALYQYSSIGYHDLNATLRLPHVAGDLKKALKEAIRIGDDRMGTLLTELDAAVAKGTVAQDTMLYRGAGEMDDLIAKFKNGTFKVGDTITEHGFTSTSASKEIAWSERFAGLKAKGGNVKIAIRTPGGAKNVMHMGAQASNSPLEVEFLFARNSQFKIVDFKIKGKNMELLVEHTGTKATKVAKQAAKKKAAKEKVAKQFKVLDDELEKIAKAKKAGTMTQSEVEEAYYALIDDLGPEYGAWYDTLSTAEIEALEAYSGNGYLEMNEYMRNALGKKGKIETALLNNNTEARASELIKQFRAIESALDKGVAHADVVTYRGMTDMQDLIAQFQKGVFKVGDTITDHAYVSTSAARDVAWGDYFAGKVGESGSIRMTVQIPKGQKGVSYISGLSQNQGELEFVLQRSSQFRIVEFEIKDGAMNLLVEYIGSAI